MLALDSNAKFLQFAWRRSRRYPAIGDIAALDLACEHIRLEATTMASRAKLAECSPADGLVAVARLAACAIDQTGCRSEIDP
jgi:hypothetical protein